MISNIVYREYASWSRIITIPLLIIALVMFILMIYFLIVGEIEFNSNIAPSIVIGVVLIPFVTYMLFTDRLNTFIEIDHDEIRTTVKRRSYVFKHNQLENYFVLKRGKIKLILRDKNGNLITNYNAEGYTMFTSKPKKLAQVFLWILEKNKYVEGQEFSNQNQTEF
ncbi:MAG: hypothetical protein FWB72_02795 [Firmicutes bacterium]|nr:hypothetical protein [Bacillota bacterium]